MNKNTLLLAFTLLLAVLFLPKAPAVAEETPAPGSDIQVKINDTYLDLNDFNGRVFVTETDRVMIPLRIICENLEFRVDYSEEGIAISDDARNLHLTFQMNERTFTYNGGQLQLTEPLVIRDGRSYIPLRGFAELFTDVAWYENERVVELLFNPDLKKRFVEVDTDTLVRILRENVHKGNELLYLGRRTCPYCVIFEDAFLPAFNQNHDKAMVAYHYNTDTYKEDADYSTIREELLAKTVPHVMFITDNTPPYGAKLDAKDIDTILAA